VRRSRSSVPAVALLLVWTSGCVSRPRVPSPEGWVGAGVVPYRLVTQDDFQAKSSSSLWGNFAHGAEICTQILPVEDPEVLAFRAVMRPDCSFWNSVIGPVGFLTRLAGLATGVPTVTPVKQPDWYILQHEQIHFAINELAARRLTRKLAEHPPRRVSQSLIRRLYAITLRNTQERHRRLDEETSGRFDAFLLEKWVRALESEFSELCNLGQECRVRNRGS
jgi:hypothetical protein